MKTASQVIEQVLKGKSATEAVDSALKSEGIGAQQRLDRGPTCNASINRR